MVRLRGRRALSNCAAALASANSSWNRDGDFEGFALPASFTIAFIGFGEVGQRFSRDLIANPNIGIKTYDILFGESPRGLELWKRALDLGVAPCAGPAEAVHDADIVVSAVTADAAEAVASRAAAIVPSGQIFFDINSAAPQTKQRSAQHFVGSGTDYVEGAVMAPVLEPGIRVPILAGGPASERAAQLLNGVGMNILGVSAEYGKASATKLCRSIMIKGIEALMVDCTEACRVWGVSEPVFSSLSATFPSVDWAHLSETMAERLRKHGARRAAEMRETASMLEAAGLDPSLALAVAGAQSRGARNDVKRSKP
jgi:3-hydroxyisobutyrate dehydrogenase-like beta-hydroxyacid dehydrogenase